MPPLDVDISLRPTNPGRPVDWRWQLATSLYEADVYDFADPIVREVAYFIRGMNALDDEASPWEVYNDHPITYDAYEVHRIQPGNDIVDRWQIEARIIAGQTDAEIHDRTGYSPAAIKRYADLFYDVRSRLKHSDFVTSHLLGRQAHGYGRAFDLELLWKIIAWVLGPDVLDWMLNRGRAAHRQDDSVDPLRLMDLCYSRNMRLRAIISAYTAPMSNDMHAVNFDAYSKARALELQAQVIGVESANQEMLSGFRRSLEDFQFTRIRSEDTDLIAAEPDYPAIEVDPTVLTPVKT